MLILIHFNSANKETNRLETSQTALCLSQEEGSALQRVIKTTQKIIGTHLMSIGNTGEATPTPATAGSPCCFLKNNTEVSTVIAQGYKAGCLLRLCDS